MSEIRYCGHNADHTSHEWSVQYADMGGLNYECPGIWKKKEQQMEKQFKYKIVETYRDGGCWNHYYSNKQNADWGMEDLKAAHPGRKYEMIKVE